jgi:Hypothetical glycosyl hydrolase 6/Beta-galactosidase trimerisation domain
MTEDRTRAGEGGPWWKDPNRVMLLNLREGDEPMVDAKALVEDVKRYEATAFCINGGGIVAFYQTRIAGHRRSRALGERDLLAEIIPEAHRQGLRVLARIDPSCAPRELAEQHPDWFARDREGQFFDVSGNYVTCPNAGYYHQRMVEIVQEIVRTYDADGIWNNQGKFAAWDTDVCYCDTCQSLFQKESGHPIPEQEDWDNPVWLQFNEWRYRRIALWVARMHAAVHEAKAQAIFISAIQLAESLETIRPGGWDVDYWIDHQDVIAFECQRRNTAPWWPGIQAKYLAGIAPDKPRWMTVSYFYPWWRMVAAPEAENRPWVAQQFANGVNSWLHINGGLSKIFDRRGIAPMQAVFQRLARWQDYFRGARSGAQVAVVFSRYTQDSYGRSDPYGRYVDAVRGYYCALLEAHVPFDVLSDKFLDAARLAQYAVLVLPNTACLTDAAVAAITAFAARGGTVVGTYEAGRYDELGGLRPDAPLAAMLGGSYGAQRSKLQSSYGYIALPEDPMVDGLGDTDVVPNDADLIEFTPGPGNIVPLTLIEPVTAHAGATISIPEYSAVTSATDIPVAVYGAHGSGQVVLFTNRMDALFYKYGFADLGRLLSNAVLLGLGNARNLQVVAPDYVDVTQQLQPGRCMVHLINFAVGKHVNTGWRHPGRNLVAVPGIRVELRLAPGQVLREVRTATNEVVLGHTLRHEQAGQGIWAEVTVPRLEDHEIVIFEFA